MNKVYIVIVNMEYWKTSDIVAVFNNKSDAEIFVEGEVLDYYDTYHILEIDVQ